MILIDLAIALFLYKVIHSKIKKEQEWKAYQKWLKKHNKENENEM